MEAERRLGLVTSAALKEIEEYQAASPYKDKSNVVHHYTSFDSFNKIIASKTFWLNETSFMNDASEMENFRKACTQNFERLAYGTDKSPHPRNRGRLWMIDEFEKLSVSSFSEPSYLASWSADQSLLSQWRAYCPKGGVSLGFDLHLLREAAAAQGLQAAWCDYGDVNSTVWENGRELEGPTSTIWRRGLETLFDLPLEFDEVDSDLRSPTIRESLAAYGLRSDQGSSEDKAKTKQKLRLLGHFSRALAPVFKDKAFKEENEFRIFTTSPNETALNVRSTDHALIRYIPFKLEKCWEKVFVSVALGPCSPEHEVALLNSVKLLLAKANSAHVQPISSQIPLRYTR